MGLKELFKKRMQEFDKAVEEQQHKKLDKIQIGLIIICVLAALYFVLVEPFGPITAFIDWQVEMTDGYYYPKITILAVTLVFLIPVLGGWHLLKKMFED